MFNNGFDKRYIYMLIVILAIFSIFSFIGDNDLIVSTLLTVPGVLIAITFHEFAHGFVAYKLGDDTAKNEGRLNLNPLSHLDPLGTLMLLVAGFGWGKPVHVNPRNYNKKISIEKGEAIVAVAGPIMNILLAFITALITLSVAKFAPEFVNTNAGGTVSIILINTMLINIGLGIFNLIPLPPLDGSKVLIPFLPSKVKYWFISNSNVFSIIFIVIFVTGISSYIITPAINIVSIGVIELASLIIGVL